MARDLDTPVCSRCFRKPPPRRVVVTTPPVFAVGTWVLYHRKNPPCTVMALILAFTPGREREYTVEFQDRNGSISKTFAALDALRADPQKRTSHGRA